MRSGYSENLSLVLAGRHDIADLLAGERAGERGYISDRAMRRIGLVLADDAEGLLAAVAALERDGRAEMHASIDRRIADHLRGSAARGPVALVALRQCD